MNKTYNRYMKTLIAKNLIFLMKQAGINPNILSLKTNVPQPTIHRITSSESNDPRTKTVQPLANYFGLSVFDLKERDLLAEAEGGAKIITPKHPLTKQEEELLALFRWLTEPQKIDLLNDLAIQKEKNKCSWTELSKVIKQQPK